MSKYKIVVCSYKRTKVFKDKTLKFLQDNDIDFKNMYLFLANEEEKKQYIEECDLPKGIKIVIGEVGMKNIRNCVVNYFNQDDKLFCIDDDITTISELKAGKLVNAPPLKDIIRDTFKLMEQHNSRLMGIYPVYNHYFMSNYIEIGNKYICGSCFFEILDKEVSHREVDSEDYNLNLNYYDKYKNNMRYGYYSAKTVYYAKGGMNSNVRTFEKKETELEFLVNKYPDYVKIKYSKSDKKIPQNVNLRYLKHGNEPLVEPDIIKDDKLFKVLRVSKVRVNKKAMYLSKSKDWVKIDKKTNYILKDKLSNKLLAVIIRDGLSKIDLNTEFYEYINKLTNYKSNNRGDIAGQIEHKRLDRYVDPETIVLNKSGCRTKGRKFDLCNSLASISLGEKNDKEVFADNKSESFNETFNNHLEPLIKKLNEIYHNYYIDMFNIKGMNKDNFYGYFSTTTINKSLRSATHKDARNTDKLSLAFVLDNPLIDNKFKGGDLLIPDYKIGFNLRTGKDIVLFYGQELLHCNDEIQSDIETDIIKNIFHSRLSFIFYSRNKKNNISSNNKGQLNT